MTITNLEPVLAAHPLLQDLPPEHLALLVGCASNLSFEAGTVIARQGEAADAFYLVRHGDVSVEVCAPGRGSTTLATVHEGGILGWSWLVEPYAWAFDARALTLVRAIRFDGVCLRRKCEENHDLGYELMRRMMVVMGDRLKAARIQLVDLYGAGER